MLIELAVKQSLRQMINQVLHWPGNVPQLPLEMTIVVDGSLERNKVKQLIKELSELLKQTSEEFRNVRVNFVSWYSNDCIEQQITGLSALILGREMENDQQLEKDKSIVRILNQLRLFQARSALILFITDDHYGKFAGVDVESLLKPNLGRKMIWLIFGMKKLDFQQRALCLSDQQIDHRVIHQFDPVFDESSKILILGTIPSPKSREQGFYYGHPRNRFWPVLADLFEEQLPQTIAEKKALCLRHHIAIWDVLSSCEINGASDNTIKNPVPNDLSVITKHSPIEAIYTTGMKATKLYQQYCYPSTGIVARMLPSTSPANCRMSYQELKENYLVLLG